jgi:hypothetical protein
MAITPTNVSFDGSPVQILMDSPMLACFDPVTLDMLGDLLPPGVPVDVPRLLERANANYSALACFTIPDFRPGLYSLDPHDIKKFGDEDDELDYGDEEVEPASADSGPSYLFAAVDSAALIVADIEQLPRLVRLLTWEQYDLSLRNQGDAVIDNIVQALGGPYFAVIHGGCMPDMPEMEFDGDGIYTIPVGHLQWVSG